MKVDLSFALVGTHPVPADHGYSLYSAVSRLLPEAHRQTALEYTRSAGGSSADGRCN